MVRENGAVINFLNSFDSVAVHCITQQEADDFVTILKSAGKTWCSGREYQAPDLNWIRYGERTCYSYTEGTFGRFDTFREEGTTVIEYSDLKKMDKDIEESPGLIAFINNFGRKGETE